MLTFANITNALNFLNRVSLTGPEAYAWVESVNALQATAHMMQSVTAQGPGVQFQGPQQATTLPEQLDLAI
jgi:hypothetical protein